MEVCFPPLHADGRGARVRIQGLVVRAERQGFAVVSDMGLHMKLHERPTEKTRVHPVGKEEKEKDKDEAKLLLPHL